jgi:hypothetical protein
MQKQVSVTVGYQFGNAPRMLTLMGDRGKGKKLIIGEKSLKLPLSRL